MEGIDLLPPQTPKLFELSHQNQLDFPDRDVIYHIKEREIPYIYEINDLLKKIFETKEKRSIERKIERVTKGNILDSMEEFSRIFR